MSGMNSGLNADDPTLTAAFRSALLRQGGIVLVIFALLLVACWLLRRRQAAAGQPARQAARHAEPRGRRMLRISFGALWIVDGILQAQPKMVAALPSDVIAPSAAASPRWVQDVVNTGASIWSFHPVQAAAAAVWIQIGLGLWLVAAEVGWWSRLAGLASAGWGLVVWVFGEAFGGVFAPGLSWLTGAPGAVVLYVLAGALISLPASAWAGERLGRLLLAGSGLLWAGMAVLQAWPGRGFWQGSRSGLAEMAKTMAQNDQPRAQAAMVSAFASFTAAHGFAVNLFAVIALGVLGLGLLGLAFWRGQRRLLRLSVPAAAAACLADWVLVQDFGVPGGLGTDPNSMLPWVLVLWAGLLALAPDLPGEPVTALAAQRGRGSAVRAALRPAAVRAAVSRTMASASTRSVTAVGAAAVVLVGAGPMAAVSADRTADPIIARAVAGASVTVSRPAPQFRLVSQAGTVVGLSSLRGKVVLLTFLDPVCPGCQTIAAELRAASGLLGTAGRDTELVAIAADSTHASPLYVRAFDRRAGLTAVPNWLFLTGTLSQLQRVWTSYEKVAPHMMVGMSARSNVTFVIDRTGRIREEIRDDPGPGTSSTRSAFAVLLCGAARQALALP